MQISAAKIGAIGKPIIRLFMRRGRRAAISRTRAYVEYRNANAEELPRLIEAVKLSACHLTRAEWFELNVHTGRVVFAFEEGAYELDELINVVEGAEQAVGIQDVPFNELRQDHPADIELGVRRLVELAADAFSTGAALALSVSPLPALPMSGNSVAALAILRGSPRLRRGIEERLGVERAEFVLNLASSMAQGLAQRPLSSLVDALHKVALLRELQARRTLWQRREADLTKAPADYDVRPEYTDRPCPLPPGPIEEYADRAWFVSLSGFALSFITTRSFQRATAALFGGLPRPARIGRDVFAAELSRSFASRGILVLDREVLRRLDRIDCLVLDADLLSREKFVIASVQSEEPDILEEARARARAMFDQDHPLEVQTDGLWRLGPWELSRASSDTNQRTSAKERARDGALVLSLERAGRVVALVEVEIMAQTGALELIQAAREARLRIVIVTRGDGSVRDAAHGFDTDDVITPTEGLRAGIRRLQRAGHGVCLVATAASPGLSLADCGIGFLRAGEPVPWGADMICREDLADVRFVMQACNAARTVSRQCVNIALGAATFGTLVSAGGLLPLTSRRVMLVINVANLISMANGVRNSLTLDRKILPKPEDPTPWYALDARGVLRRLGSTDAGLAAAEAVRRRPGAQKAKSRIAELGEAFTDELFNPLAPLLAAGAGLSAVTGSVTDASMVAGVVGLNALVGGVQRFRTEQKIRELARTQQLQALVRRDGREAWVSASVLVPGDLILLGAGDVVPADCRIFDDESLEVDASSITGESLPVPKGSAASFETSLADQSSMLHAGTTIAAGRATAIVTAVGEGTEAARGANIAKRSRATGGVEARLRTLMDITGPVAIAAGVGVIGAGLLRGRKLEELVSAGVSLAVASVPEGLPVLATAAQLAAAERLAKRHALVRNIRAIEALGRVDVICLDKTGTLTEGHVELSALSNSEHEEALSGPLSDWASYLLGAALRAAGDVEAERLTADPMDDALWRAAGRVFVSSDFGARVWKRRQQLSFSSTRGYHVAVGDYEAGSLLDVKGAPEVILPLCDLFRQNGEVHVLDADARFKLAANAARAAAQGFRVLAVAERQTSQGVALSVSDVNSLHFLGFLIFSDPVRQSSRRAIERLAKAGVRTVMITGDHQQTGIAVARAIGLPYADSSLTGAEMARLADTELEERIRRVGVVARVTPAQKLRVVRALQRSGRVVAMVGDGANDAPAMRLADVGVAIGEHSTAAARAAADVVLMDGRVETLIDAIAEGRAMWASVRDAVSILLGGNFGEIAFTLGAGLIDGTPPLNARQLLLVNLLTDVAPAMAIALRPPSLTRLENLANEHPDKVLGSALTRDMALRAATTALGAGSAWTIARITGTRAKARTVGLAALVGTQLAQTLRSGSAHPPVVLTSLGSATVMFAIIQTPGLSHFFGCRPLGPFGWATALGASAGATGLLHLVTSFLAGEWGTVAAGRGGEPRVFGSLSLPPQRLPVVPRK